VGNLVVLRPGSGGGEAAPPVVIQVRGALRGNRCLQVAAHLV